MLPIPFAPLSQLTHPGHPPRVATAQPMLCHFAKKLFAHFLKKVQNHGGMAGEARASRWKGNQDGGDELAASRNASNAAAVAGAKAQEVSMKLPYTIFGMIQCILNSER